MMDAFRFCIARKKVWAKPISRDSGTPLTRCGRDWHMDAITSHPPDQFPVLLDALIGLMWLLAPVTARRQCGRMARLCRAYPGLGTLMPAPFWACPSGMQPALIALAAVCPGSHPFEGSRSNGYVFVVELAYLATLAGLSFAEVPIYFAERTEGDRRCPCASRSRQPFVWRLRDYKKKASENNLLNFPIILLLKQLVHRSCAPCCANEDTSTNERGFYGRDSAQKVALIQRYTRSGMVLAQPCLTKVGCAPSLCAPTMPF